MRTIATFLAIALFSVSAFAADDTSAPKAEPAKPERVVKLICKLEKPIGTQMVKRTCMTPEQAEAAREAAVRSMDQAQRCSRAGC